MKAGRVLVAAVIVCSCATNPATGRRQVILMSESQEISLGKQADAEARRQMGLYDSAQVQQYIDRVGARLTRASHRPKLPWSFAVVDEPAVNAFALPGGYIYLTRGILPFLRDEAELAAVLAHEVGHVDARHHAAAYSRQTLAGGGLAVLGVLVPETRPLQGLTELAFGLLFLRHGRDDELEADRLGVSYASTAGWEPGAMAGLLNTLARLDAASGRSRGVPNWALTHPPAADRVTRIGEAVAATRSTGARVTNQPEFERLLDGLVFGDSREKGIVRGNDFLHPVLGFAVRFPERWEIVNTNQQVAARESEAGNVAMVLELATASGSVQQTARTGMTKAGLREVEGRTTNVNGLPAYVGTYEGAFNGTRVGVRAAHILAGGRIYLVAGIAPASQFGRVDDTFDSSILTFRTLSRQEAERIQPDRVDFHVVRAGETWDSLARGVSGGRVRASTLAIMNGSDPQTPPRAGSRIRVVVSGM